MPVRRTPQESDGTSEVHGVYLASLTERHWLCICTWVWDYGYNTFRLKYRNTVCQAGRFHRRIEAASKAAGEEAI